MNPSNDDKNHDVPRFLAHAVHTYDKGDGSQGRRWSRIGVAFPHKDKPGFNIQLDAIPTNGLIVLLPPDEARAEDRASADNASTRPAARGQPARPAQRR